MKHIFVWVVILIFLSGNRLHAGPYTSSAHGDSAYGVSRRSIAQYAGGHCAHCHEQHASIDGKRPPYSAADKSYVLACTDCHEPHGSPNYGYLIRKTVNGGVTDLKANTNSDWNTLCSKCHTRSHSMHSCITCHYHGAYAF